MLNEATGAGPLHPHPGTARHSARVERAFVATVGFAFRPRVGSTLEAVWRNPLGFVVTSYRIDAETVGG